MLSCLKIFTEKGSEKWLFNSSFTSQIAFTKPVIDISSTSSEDESEQVLSVVEDETGPGDVINLSSDSSENERLKAKKRHKKKKKKHKQKKVKTEVKYEREVKNVYFEDKIRDKRMCTVQTLCSRARPYYDSSNLTLGFISTKRFKRKVSHRYYISNIDMGGKSKKKVSIFTKAPSVHYSEDPLPEWCVNIDQEKKNRTQEFNEKLEKNPYDIELWLQYVDFQVYHIIFILCIYII